MALVALKISSQPHRFVEFDNSEGFEKADSHITNDTLADCTTCLARLELFKILKTVGRNILYCDTDSLIFTTKKWVGRNVEVQYENYAPIGSILGEFTNELKPGTYIKEFVCTAPKSYSYVTKTGEESTKFKGVVHNWVNSRRANFEAVKDLLFGTRDNIVLEPHTLFKRDKF